MFHVKHVSVQQSFAVNLNDVGKWQRHRIGQTQYVGICRCFLAMFHVKQQRLERRRASITPPDCQRTGWVLLECST